MTTRSAAGGGGGFASAIAIALTSRLADGGRQELGGVEVTRLSAISGYDLWPGLHRRDRLSDPAIAACSSATYARRHRTFVLQTKNREYSGWGSSWATMARPGAMIMATMPSMRSVLSCHRRA